MFSRWSQENYIKYMRQHYNIDRLVEYSTEGIPDTAKVVNPEYRRFDGEIRKRPGGCRQEAGNSNESYYRQHGRDAYFF